MNGDFKNSIVTGLERVSAWADLLDRINVYPVADGDTGRNLKISLSPLRQLDDDHDKTLHSLMLSARGNSGNIAARFFSGFLNAHSLEELPDAAKKGRDNAWNAVNDPKEGTMLSVYDALVEVSSKGIIGSDDDWVDKVIDHLEESVHSTMEMLPKLKEANVIDAGALGMFIFFEGFFRSLTGSNDDYRQIMEIFKDKLTLSSSFQEQSEAGYCIDMVMQVENNTVEAVNNLTKVDDNVVVIRDEDYLKVHFHTDNKNDARKRLESYGNIINWTDDNLEAQINEFSSTDVIQKVHIMTDGAGSVTRSDVRKYGITLLDSYVLYGDRCIPETHLTPEELYKTMKSGVKASTSQASDFERHQHYQSALSIHPNVLYLCVGSVYTGNYDIAVKWKNENDLDNRFEIVDTGTASGKLGLIVLAAARYSQNATDLNDVKEYAEQAIEECDEYIFLEKLQYLAAGGRMSKTGAFFGDMFNVKPIVSPRKDGASKAGVVRNTKDQLKFMREKINEKLTPDSKAFIMLEYTNNRSWVEEVVKKEIEQLCPASEIIIQPLSLTTGVHTGPGTWAVAFLDVEKLEQLTSNRSENIPVAD